MPRLIEPSDDIFDVENCDDGDWAFDVRGLTIFIVLPGRHLAGLPLRSDSDYARRDGTGPIWSWDGNREAPTITPSILNLSTGWHGFMRAGKLESV